MSKSDPQRGKMPLDILVFMSCLGERRHDRQSLLRQSCQYIVSSNNRSATGNCRILQHELQGIFDLLVILMLTVASFINFPATPAASTFPKALPRCTWGRRSITTTEIRGGGGVVIGSRFESGGDVAEPPPTSGE